MPTIPAFSVLSQSTSGQEGGMGLLLVPAASVGVGTVVDPVADLGPITITPAQSVGIGTVQDPTIISGGITIVPAPSIGVGTVVDPTIDLGPITIVPNASIGIGTVVDPTVFTTLVIVPAPSVGLATAEDPAIVLGPTTVVPAASRGIGTVVDPVVVLGAVNITPSQSIGIGTVVDPTVSDALGAITPEPSIGVATVGDPVVVLGPVTVVPPTSIGIVTAVDPIVIGGLRAPLAWFNFAARGRRGQMLESINYGVLKHPDEMWDVGFNLTAPLKSRGLKILSIDAVEDGVGNAISNLQSALIIDDYRFSVTIDGGEADREYVLHVTFRTDPFAKLVACGRVIVDGCLGGTTVITPAPSSGLIDVVDPTVVVA